MVSKESLANIAAKAVRLIPGISSYQDKEKLRDIDKRLRNQLASTLDEERARIDDVKSLFSKKLKFDLLDDLDTVTKKMLQLADTIKFSAYGYSPLFDQGAVDKKKLEELYQFDQSLDEELTSMKGQVDKLVSASETGLPAGINEVQRALGTLEKKLKSREELLKQVK
ncbi:MAG: hypothetical protein V2A69_03870 [Pseudomonadota bacterium]